MMYTVGMTVYCTFIPNCDTVISGLEKTVVNGTEKSIEASAGRPAE